MGVSSDTYAWLVRNRIVTLEMMKDDLIDYFSTSDEVLCEVLWPEGGFFDSVTLAADGNDKFKIGGLGGIDGTVGGDLLYLTNRQADVEGIQFENSNLVDYHVGLRDARLPDTSTPNITVNPKDGLPNWTFFRHIIGISGAPDVVVDNGNGTITFHVNTITENAVSNAGRVVKVFQLTPAKGAVTDAIAMESLPVVWDSPSNKITTVGNLGQTTISTTVADYVVVLVGPHVLRNTDISADVTYAYVGTVQGVGAGSPPSVFDVSGQRLLSASSSLLWQITRTENVPPNRLKIDVKAIAGEVGIGQIRVTDSASVVKFSVDEAGNVVVEGDLDVKGTTTTRDVDQVNAYNAYFDNLDAGNADTDVHNIKGEWTHTSSGGGITAFAIDGDTGRVGIGGSYDSTPAHALKVAGVSFYTDDLIPAATACLGSPTAYWCDIYATTYHIGGALLPDVTDSFDIGRSTPPLKWQDLYLSGTAYVDTGIDIASSAIVGDAVSLALSDIPFRIRAAGAGTNEKNWALEIASGANEVLTLAAKTDGWTAGVAFFEAKRTVDSTVIEKLTLSATQVFIEDSLYVSGTSAFLGKVQPAGHQQWELGDASNHWQKFYLSSNAGHGVATDLVPFSTSLDLGNSSYPWQKLFLSNAAGNGVATHLVPVDVAPELGNPSYPWRKLFLATGAGTGVGTSLVPATTSLDLGNTGYPWRDVFASGTVEGGQFKATDLVGSGGGADTVTFTAGTAATASPGATVLAGGNQNAGFIKIFVADTVAYLAYWTVIV